MAFAVPPTDATTSRTVTGRETGASADTSGRSPPSRLVEWCVAAPVGVGSADGASAAWAAAVPARQSPPVTNAVCSARLNMVRMRVLLV